MNFFAPKFARGKHHHESTATTDPLLKRAHGKILEHHANKAHNDELTASTMANPLLEELDKASQFTLLVTVPFFNYVIMIILIVFLYYDNKTLVLMIYFIIVVIGSGQYLLVDFLEKGKPKEWRKWIGGSSAIAATVALVVGLFIHYEYMLFYYAYHDMQTYTNVAAAQNAIDVEDGGVVHFAEGGIIDKARAVGYWDARESRTICVAPIVDGRMNIQDRISFLAVGINCCSHRADFHCDDWSKPKANGGLLVLQPHTLVPPGWEWAVYNPYSSGAFEKAVNIQKAVYDAHVADHHRFVRWFEDPQKKISSYRHRSMELAIYACLAYLVVVLPYAIRNKRKDDKKRRELLTAFQDRARYGAVLDSAQDALAVNA